LREPARCTLANQRRRVIVKHLEQGSDHLV